MKKLLDHGYVKFIEPWGSDERIIEAARMSTDGGFVSWEPYEGHPKGDAGLLAHLYKNKHSTPFEMAGMVIEIKAPIFVFREWHRHRTQSYNEMSARYIPLPNENYIPTRERIIEGAKPSTNRQAAGTVPLVREAIDDWLKALNAFYIVAEATYLTGLAMGIPKELARLPVPVARYSRMRASTNLRNWLAFLTLRQAPQAQWEIRQYANAVGELVAEHFPRTWGLYATDR